MVGTKSGCWNAFAVAANSASSYQPAGLQVSHCTRAKPIGSLPTASAPASRVWNHWYHHSRACSKLGSVPAPPGA